MPQSRCSAKKLTAGVAAQQSRTQREGHLIGVSDPIVADKSVLSKQLGVADVGNGGVVYRQMLLIAIRHIKVEQPRLERLLQAIKSCHPALQKQTTVDRNLGKNALSRSTIKDFRA